METVVDTDSQTVLLPQVNFFLENEIRNATIMLNRMAGATATARIPSKLLEMAHGLVFLTIIKAGFIISGRYGTGLVVSRLPDNTWSAPSAITISGMGWGLQAGGELTDVLLVLSTDDAVETFKSRGQVSIGAELGVSAGPYGRTMEADLTAGNKGAAHAFSYALSQGLFLGVSLEACVIGQRKDVNATFYGAQIGASALLAGDIPRPRGAEPLYKAIDQIVFDGHVPFDVTENRIREYSAVESNMAEGGKASSSVLPPRAAALAAAAASAASANSTMAASITPSSAAAVQSNEDKKVDPEMVPKDTHAYSFTENEQNAM